MKILLLGATGSGKSTFVEKWMNIKGFSSSTHYSCTEFPMIFEKESETLIDTPGLFDCNEKMEKRSQAMMNNLSNQLRATKEINIGIIFHKYTSRLDSNFYKMIEEYQTLLNPRNKFFLLCFTGMVQKAEKESLDNIDWRKKNESIIGHCYFCLNDEYNIDTFAIVKEHILETLPKIVPHKSYLIDKIILVETQLSKLEVEKNYYKRDSDKYKKEIMKIEKEIKKCRKLRVVSQENLCPGITREGYRCSGTRNCHWYQNYLKGVSNAHMKIEERYEEFLAIEMKKFKINKNRNSKEIKNTITIDKLDKNYYQNPVTLEYPLVEPLPLNETSVGIYIIKIQ